MQIPGGSGGSGSGMNGGGAGAGGSSDNPNIGMGPSPGGSGTGGVPIARFDPQSTCSICTVLATASAAVLTDLTSGSSKSCRPAHTNVTAPSSFAAGAVAGNIKTKGGTAGGAACKFPFKWKGKT